MIYSQASDGKQRILVFNSTVLSPGKNDSLSFQLPQGEDVIFTFNVYFSDEGEANTTRGELKDNGKTLDITLYKWVNTLGTEVTEPIVYNYEGRTYLIKFRTAADPSLNFRSFHLTVWQNL